MRAVVLHCVLVLTAVLCCTSLAVQAAYADQVVRTLSDLNREFVVITPNIGVSPTRLPHAPALLLWFHGIYGNCKDEGDAAALRATLEARADAPNIAVVAMCGLPQNGPGWNIYEQNWANSYELAYTRRVIEEMHRLYNVDTTKVFAAGFSMGGMMASSIACHAPELIIGVNFNGCALACAKPTTPMFMLAVQGLQDGVCPDWATRSYESLAGAMGCAKGTGSRRSVMCQGKQLQLFEVNGPHTVINSAEFSAHVRIVETAVNAIASYTATAPVPAANPNPVAADACQSFERLDGKEISGSDLVDLGGVAMFEACADQCRRVPGCVGFVERSGGGRGVELHCVLKRAVPASAISNAPSFTSLGRCTSGPGPQPTCSAPANPSHGQFTCSGSTCSLVCDSGYTATGTGVASCANGAWSTLPTCALSGGAGTSACGVATEGNALSLTCPSGQLINAVEFASYGNPQGSCSNSVVGSCHSTSSLAVVQGACVGKASCVVSAANSVFGDPCPGTAKQLAVRARCGTAGGAATPTCATGGEWATVTVTCPRNTVVTSISFASYGTPSTPTCGSFSKSSCHAASTLDIVQRQCVGKNTCSFSQMNSMFGDPCPGTGKTLAITALCA